MTPRTTHIITFFLAAAGLWACWCRIAMGWDGAYQFCSTLIYQQPFQYMSRFSSWLLWIPTVWASHATTNMPVLEMVFGAPFCIAPVLGFALSTWVLPKESKYLLFWVALGICWGALPGQAFMINESILQMHLFWPVFLLALCPANRAKYVVIGLLAILQSSHPIGIGLCGMTAVVSLITAWRSPEHRRNFCAYAVWNFLISAAGIVKLILFPDPYAASEAHLDTLLVYFYQGVFGLPLLSLLCVYASVVLALRFGAQNQVLRARCIRIAMVLVVVAGVAMVIWGASPHLWWKSLDYRRWLVPLCLPFFAGAWWETFRPPSTSPEVTRFRGQFNSFGSVIFAVVLGLQSATWRSMSARLEGQVRTAVGPVFPAESIGWTKETIMDHWSISALILTFQPSVPYVLLISEKEIESLVAEPQGSCVPLSPFTFIGAAPGPAGWFDFRPVVNRICDRADPIRKRIHLQRSEEISNSPQEGYPAATDTH